MSDSSDESDYENIQMLLEAADTTLLSNNLYCKSKNTDDNIKTSVNLNSSEPINQKLCNNLPKSQRYIEADDNEPSDSLNVSESMQQFFARKLTKMIESQTEFVESNYSNDENSNKKPKKQKSKIKLLKDFDVWLHDDITSQNYPDMKIINRKKPKIKRRLIESDNKLSELEKCKIAAIDPSFIYSGQEIKNWSNRSKAQVFLYIKNGSKYVYVESEKEIFSSK